MSWLFGMKSDTPDMSSFLPPPPPSDPPNDDAGRSQGHVSEAYRFDSTALERAAKAAKELENNKNAEGIIQMTISQENAKSKENEKAIEQYRVEVERLKIEQTRVSREERMKVLAEEGKQKQRVAEYQDQLSRKRYDDQLAQQARMQEDNKKKEEESLVRQEAIKRKALQQEMELRSKHETMRAEAEARARGIVEKENKDIHIEKLRVEADEMRKTVLESIRTAGGVLGSGIQYVCSDKEKVLGLIAGLSTLALGVYAAKFGTRTTAKYIGSRLNKPSLIKETSRLSVNDLLKHPLQNAKKLWKREGDPLKGIILKPDLEERLRDVAIATQNTKRNKGFYQNLLFSGPPGTGKTMFAKMLAKNSGMDFAIFSGADVAPMGRQGVSAIHSVFDWANTSRKGLLVFVDEADAFLKKRSGANISESVRASLNAFLFRTGELSKNFMLVLASNQPEQFDWAINDRMDDVVPFELPSLHERDRMVRLYFDLFVLQPSIQGSSQRLKVAQFDYGAKCSEIAEKTQGLSGREIAKLGVSWQAASYTSLDGVLTETMIDALVQRSVRAHQRKGTPVDSHLFAPKHSSGVHAAKESATGSSV